MKPSGVATVAQLVEFDEIIDARTPLEYAADHVPGAINLPVLDNEERVKIGTLYKQVSAFDAKKLGAALVSRNIAHHLEAHFLDKPKSYRPLVYCWRGGNRSGALTHVLQKIGFAAAQLEGGYKGYRHKVVEDLATLPSRFQFKVICGPTGSGKSRLLQALTQIGAQVLDLEALAAHRGSVLGILPDQPQPSQKSFETGIWQHLHRMSADRPVFVESESRKIGSLQVPDGVISVMRSSPCIHLELPLEARIRLLVDDYTHFLETPELLVSKLDLLVDLRGKETLDAWRSLIEKKAWPALVGALLEEHYDPAYQKSLARNYGSDITPASLAMSDIAPGDYERAARSLLI